MVMSAMDGGLHSLWDAAPQPSGRFHAEMTAGLPDPARRFLLRAIAEDAPLCSAVHLRMHGEIKLKKWARFEAEQVISYPAGFVWEATAQMGLPILGFDRLLGEEGEMQWKILGLLPVMQGRGADIARSAAGRMAGELCWLPSAMAAGAVRWEEPNDGWQPYVAPTPAGEVKAALSVSPDGLLQECQIERWGSPGGGSYLAGRFGVVFTAHRTFGNFTIGSVLTAGWNYPDDPGGAFFRAVIDDAIYR